MKLTAKIPGNTMIMGEHAVLHGYPAIGAAVNQYMHLRLATRTDSEIHIQSALGEYHAQLDNIQDDETFRFIVEALNQCPTPIGFDLTIESEFSHTVGLGSSAALTVGIIALLHRLQDKAFCQATILKNALCVVRKVQGSGSGTDLAISTYGGMIHYQPETLVVESIPYTDDYSLHYVGYKTPTPEVIRLVKARAEQAPELFQSLYRLIGQTTETAIQAAQQHDWSTWSLCLNTHHGLQDALGTSNQDLSDLCYTLSEKSGAQAAKICGSGLGDCVLAYKANKPFHTQHPIEFSIAPEGVTLNECP